MNGHLACAVVQTDTHGNFLGWYPYCATCDKFGARCRDEAMAADVAAAHAGGTLDLFGGAA